MPTVLLSPPVLEEFGDALRAIGGEGLQLLAARPEQPPTAQQLAQVDIALFSLDIIGSSTKTELTPYMRFYSDLLRAAPALRWLHVPTAGVDRPIFQEMLRRGVQVTNSSGANAEAVAHTALMGVTVLARGGLHWLRAQREHRWAPLRGEEAPNDLGGQTAIVVGLGAIGQSIARLLEALGLRVLRLRHAPQPGDAERGIHAYAQLRELAPQAHWLVIACPLTEATRGLADAQVLQAMPRGSFVVNVGRGGVLDERALLQALASGHIAGAHLDVFEQEPLPPDSPFWDLPNVIVTPHNGGSTRQYAQRCVHLFIDNLARWVRGEPLLQQVPAHHTLGAG